MAENSGEPAEDPRARAARTKRARTQAALLTAALRAFQAQGWTRSRMEEIAASAGVSVATAYKHFSGKDVLLAHVYAPFVHRELDKSRRRSEAGTPTATALEAHIRDLASMMGEQESLTLAYIRAVSEYAEKVGGPVRPDDPDDPRVIAPIADEVSRLVSAGQLAGEFRPHPPASEIANTVVYQMLGRAISSQGKPAQTMAELSLTTLFALLTPEMLVEAGFTGRPFAAAD